MKQYLFLPALVFSIMILTQCQQPIAIEYQSFTDFPVSVELSHIPINIEKPIMHPSGFVFLDSALVVLDLSGDYFLNFFNLDGFDFMHHSIRRGRGPLEEESFFFISNALGKNELWYKTHSGIKIVRYVPGNDELVLVRIFQNCDSFQGNTYLLGNDVLGIPYPIHDKSNYTEFVKIFADDYGLADFGADFPNVEKNLSLEEKRDLFGTKSFAVKPDGELFAASYQYFPILRIFNTSDGSLKIDIRLNNNQDFPDAKTGNDATPEGTMNTTTNYFVSRSTNQFIYSSYSGKSMLELQPNILREGFRISDFTNEIHVFDWEGQPMKRIILDKNIFTFAVSPDDNTLVAISMSDPDVLLKYDLAAAN